jgi:RND family efflux transporter MFP subunit
MSYRTVEFVIDPRSQIAKKTLLRLRRVHAIVTALLLTIVLMFHAACDKGTAATPPPPPPNVEVVNAIRKSVTLSTEWIATLDGYVNAQVRPQVSGYLLKRNYREGSVVKAGQVLFEIDPRPFQAALSQAKAQLAEAEAQRGRTSRDVERDTPLAQEKAIAQSQLDNDVQANLAAQAAVQSATALVETSQLNLGFTKVTSLVDGVAAIATAQIGDLVGPGTLLTTVSQIAPIKAYFPVSEQEYLRIANRLNSATGSQQPWDSKAGLELILSDGSVYPKKGSFLAADRDVDVKTGTIRMSAVFPNPANVLRPGQYGRIRANTRTVADATLIPQRAVAELQGHYQIRVVDSNNRITTRTVTLGERVGRLWIVASGLKPGERVAVQSAQSVKDDSVVTPKTVAPAEGE